MWYKLGQYLKCCDAINNPNCNHESINISSCTTTPNTYIDWDIFFADVTACLYSDDTFRQYICDDDVTEITCDGYEAISSHGTDCLCSTFSVLYNRLGSTSQAMLLQDWINPYIHVQSLWKWNDVFGCDINVNVNVTCDWTSTLNPDSDPDPSKSPTVSPVNVNTCDGDAECDSDEVCLANGDCQSKISITQCTSTAECIQSDGKNYECELENNGGFCYYSECKKDGECQTGYICNVATDTNDDVLFAYGICEGDQDESGVRRLIWNIWRQIVAFYVCFYISVSIY